MDNFKQIETLEDSRYFWKFNESSGYFEVQERIDFFKTKGVCVVAFTSRTPEYEQVLNGICEIYNDLSRRKSTAPKEEVKEE